MIAVSVKEPNSELAFTEWRLDLFQSLTQLPQSKNAIFTLKNGSLIDIERFAGLKPAYIDLDISVPKEFVERIRSMGICVIRSFHDYDKTPENLSKILDELQTVSAEYYKIACKAASSIDTLRLLAFAKQAPSNCLLMTMGDTGHISRILAPVVGRTFTYACEDDNDPIVTGQISYHTLQDTYAYNSLNTSTKIYGLIGDPVDKSISHISHNRAMQHHNLSSVYVKIPVKGDDLGRFFEYARQLGIRGLSVTTPHKEEVMKYCTRITDDAQAIGAVNTLVLDGDMIIGSNTDGLGACNAIEQHISISGKKVVVIGAGGAAKAIAWQAHQRGADVTICNRDTSKARILASCIGCRAEDLGFDYDIIINATSTGMPIDPRYILAGKVAMDVRTVPSHTEFLIEAQKRGCHCIYGYEMFLHQAILQYKTWFNDLDATEILTHVIKYLI